MNCENLIGQKFNRLTVIERAPDYISPNGIKKTKWKCLCDCGNTVEVLASSLKTGNNKSCGCLKKDKGAKQFYSHGKSRTRPYRIYAAIKQRCYNEHKDRYSDYGERGITMCDEWRNDFQAFYNWAMNNGYADDLTIDRIDVNGNYEPSNCRWVTAKAQSNNTRANHYETYNGERLTLSQFASKYKIKYGTLLSRIQRGWSIKRAIETGVVK